MDEQRDRDAGRAVRGATRCATSSTDDDSVGLRRILDTVVDAYELDGDGWLALTKNVTDGDGPA